MYEQMLLQASHEMKNKRSMAWQIPVEASIGGADYRNGLLDSESKQFQVCPVSFDICSVLSWIFVAIITMYTGSCFSWNNFVCIATRLVQEKGLTS